LQDKTGKNLKDLMNDKFKEEQPDQDITNGTKEDQKKNIIQRAIDYEMQY